MTQRDSLWNVSVAMTPRLRAALDTLKSSHEGKLRFVYDEAVRAFLKRREHECVRYYPPRKGSKQRTVWIDRTLYDAIREAADEDDITLSLCIVTAFIDYCKDQGVFDAQRKH